MSKVWRSTKPRESILQIAEQRLLPVRLNSNPKKFLFPDILKLAVYLARIHRERSSYEKDFVWKISIYLFSKKKRKNRFHDVIKNLKKKKKPRIWMSTPNRSIINDTWVMLFVQLRFWIGKKKSQGVLDKSSLQVEGERLYHWLKVRFYFYSVGKGDITKFVSNRWQKDIRVITRMIILAGWIYRIEYTIRPSLTYFVFIV